MKMSFDDFKFASICLFVCFILIGVQCKVDVTNEKQESNLPVPNSKLQNDLECEERRLEYIPNAKIPYPTNIPKGV